MIRSVSSFLCNVKVCQRLPEYGVHFHRVLPEKRSLTGIMLGIYSKGVLIFEVLNGNRTPVLRFPWRDTKKISFTVRFCMFTFGDNCTAVLEFLEKKKAKEVQLQAVLHEILYLECQGHTSHVFLCGRKRRFACRILRTGSNICFRQTVRRPASICCTCARPSTNSTCTWKPDRTTKNCKTWVRKKEQTKMETESVHSFHFILFTFYEAVKEQETA